MTSRFILGGAALAEAPLVAVKTSGATAYTLTAAGGSFAVAGTAKWTAIALIASGATGPVGFIPPDIGLASGTWSQPPARIRQVQYQALAEPVRDPNQEFVTLDKWYASWRDPVRVVPRLQVSVNPYFFPSANPVVSFGWHQRLSEPVRTRRLQTGAQSFFVSIIKPEVSISWFNPLADPPKQKISLSAANQQFIAFVKADPFPEAVFESKWHQAWVEPVRIKRGLDAAAQQAFTSTLVTIFETVTLDKWYFSWPTPPKPKISLRAADQQFIALVKADPFPEAVFESKWHQPWSEPVRRKPPLRTAPETAMVPFTLPYAIVSFGWNVPQTDLPPRRQPGLEAWYQQAFAGSATQPLVINITGILAAIETRDVAQFGGITYSAPYEALVGIREDAVPPTPASPVVSLASVNVSIREV